MPYKTQTNNVVFVERVAQQQPTAQPQIIYVNAQPQQREEKEQQQPELEQLAGCWSVLYVLHDLTHPH